MKPEFHEFSAMFPLLEGKPFDDLVKDIEAHGQRELIVTLDGKILDGRNRYLACQKLGITPRLRELTCVDGDALAFVWSANAERRHLTVPQLCMAATKRAELAQNGYNQHAQKEGMQVGIPSKNPIITIDSLAKATGLPARTIARAKMIRQHGTKEEIAAIERGTMSLNKADLNISARRREAGSLLPRGNKGRRLIHAGNRIYPPAGLSVEDYIRKGLELEEEKGVRAEDAAEKLSISHNVYRKFRDIILLSDREDLSKAEEKLVELAISDINLTGQTNAHKTIVPIVNRIWGNSGVRFSKRAAKRVEEFEHKVNTILFSTEANVDLPHLTKAKAELVIEDLEEAISNIQTLITRIKEIYFE